MLLWAMFWDWRIDSSGCGDGGHSDSLPCLPIRGIYAKIMIRRYVLYYNFVMAQFGIILEFLMF